MQSLILYYQLLGIPENAVVDEIKKAFRIKTKQYHPDINSNPDAREKFIAIHEAYEILLYHKTRLSYNTIKDQYQRSKISENELSKVAKIRAESFANTSYTNYKKTAYYSKSKSVKEATYFVELVFYFVLIIIIPIVLSFFIGMKYACFAALGLIVITMPDWIPTVASAPDISFNGIKEGLKLLK